MKIHGLERLTNSPGVTHLVITELAINLESDIRIQHVKPYTLVCVYVFVYREHVDWKR
jgi:hypothetical protein